MTIRLRVQIFMGIVFTISLGGILLYSFTAFREVMTNELIDKARNYALIAALARKITEMLEIVFADFRKPRNTCAEETQTLTRTMAELRQAGHYFKVN